MKPIDSKVQMADLLYMSSIDRAIYIKSNIRLIVKIIFIPQISLRQLEFIIEFYGFHEHSETCLAIWNFILSRKSFQYHCSVTCFPIKIYKGGLQVIMTILIYYCYLFNKTRIIHYWRSVENKYRLRHTIRFKLNTDLKKVWKIHVSKEASSIFICLCLCKTLEQTSARFHY